MTFISIACWTMGILAYLAGSWAMARYSIEVARLKEIGTWRSLFLFPGQVMSHKAFRKEIEFRDFPYLERSDEFPLGYYIKTALFFWLGLPAGVLVVVCSAPGRFWEWLTSLKIKRKPIPPKIRVIESDTNRATTKLLDERKKLLEERGKLRVRLPLVEQRLNELGALLDEPRGDAFRDAPRSAKSQAT